MFVPLNLTSFLNFVAVSSLVSLNNLCDPAAGDQDRGCVWASLRIFSTFFQFVLSSFEFVFLTLLLIIKDLLGSFR